MLQYSAESAQRILSTKPVYYLSVKPIDGNKRSIEIAATSNTSRAKKIFRGEYV